MAKITLKGNPVNTMGDLPKVGSKSPDFKLVKNDLSEATLATYKGKRKVLSIFPSVDTATCAMSVRKFNEKAAGALLSRPFSWWEPGAALAGPPDAFRPAS